MADRIEIDALLISALYGELTPADEARLAAHLESHPADRTALGDLTRTRDAIRESRVLDLRSEPPSSVSALLLREAARLSPRPAESSRETTGWFLRFTRMFLAHPAMAAAAMLVLVVGVAATLYVRHGDRVIDAGAVAMETTAASAGSSAEGAHARPPLAARLDSQKADRYQVAFATDGSAGPAAEPVPAPVTTAAAPQSARPASPAPADDGKIVAADEQLAPTKSAKRKRVDSADPSDTGGAGRGIELRKQEMMPKDLDDDRTVARARPDDGKERQLGFADKTAPDRAERAAATKAQPPAPAKPASVPTGSIADIDDEPRRTIARGAPAQAAVPSQVAAGGAGADDRADNKPAEADEAKLGEESSADRALVSWVRKQHQLVRERVKASDCRAAATAATEIYTRAPGYYAANVTNDRSVKPCLSYLNSEREREERRLAAKRPVSADAPAASAAPAAPPPAAPPPAPPATRK